MATNLDKSKKVAIFLLKSYNNNPIPITITGNTIPKFVANTSFQSNLSSNNSFNIDKTNVDIAPIIKDNKILISIINPNIRIKEIIKAPHKK